MRVRAGLGVLLPARVPAAVSRHSNPACLPQRTQEPQAGCAGPADGRGGGPSRRRDIHRQVRPREGAVPLGPLRQEEREEFLLGAGVQPLGGQELRLRAGAAHRAGSRRGLPRRRPGPADHHRARLQRPEHAAVGTAGEHDAERRALAVQQGRRPTATPTRLRFEDKKGEEQLWLHAEKDQADRGRERRGQVGWAATGARRSTATRPTTSSKTAPRRWTATRRSPCTAGATEEVDGNETITIHSNRTERVDHNETISIGDNRSEQVGINETIAIGANRTETVGANEDDHDRGQPHRERGRERVGAGSAPTAA